MGDVYDAQYPDPYVSDNLLRSEPTKPRVDRDAWLTAIRDAQAADLPSSDALTVAELGALLGFKKEAAARRAQMLVAAGKAEKTTKRVMITDGQVRTVTAYRLLTP